jgi:cytoskeleton protein RodZ
MAETNAATDEPKPDGSNGAADTAIRIVGAEFARLRSQRGEQLEDVARYLRIKATYLYGIEQGDLSVLPGPTYALGFARSYADYLGLDGNVVVEELRRYISGMAEAEAAKAETRGGFAGVPKTAAVIIGIAVLAGVGTGWTYLRYTNQLGLPSLEEQVGAEPGGEGAGGVDGNGLLTSERQPVAFAEEEPDESAAQPVGTTAGLARNIGSNGGGSNDGEPFPAATELQPPAAVSDSDAELVDLRPEAGPPGADLGDGDGADLSPGEQTAAALRNTVVAARAVDANIYGAENADARVAIRALASSWVQVSSRDRDYQWTRTLKVGDTLYLPNRDDLELWTGNAGGVEVLVDGEVVAPLGPSGSVIRGVSLAPDRLLSGDRAGVESGSVPSEATF